MNTPEDHRIALDIPGGLYTRLVTLADGDGVSIEALALGLLAQVVAHGPPAALAGELSLLREEVQALELALLRLTGGERQGRVE